MWSLSIQTSLWMFSRSTILWPRKGFYFLKLPLGLKGQTFYHRLCKQTVIANIYRYSQNWKILRNRSSCSMFIRGQGSVKNRCRKSCDIVPLISCWLFMYQLQYIYVYKIEDVKILVFFQPLFRYCKGKVNEASIKSQVLLADERFYSFTFQFDIEAKMWAKFVDIITTLHVYFLCFANRNSLYTVQYTLVLLNSTVQYLVNSTQTLYTCINTNKV